MSGRPLDLFGRMSIVENRLALQEELNMQASDDDSSARVGPSESQESAFLAGTLRRKLQSCMTQEVYLPMRGVLKKKGGGKRTAFQTWNWRYCVLHDHALVVHDGKDKPGAVRSSVPLKDVLLVRPEGTADESGGRPFAFCLQSIDRTWIFCAMSGSDMNTWIAKIQANMSQSANLRQKYGLGGEESESGSPPMPRRASSRSRKDTR
jgi:hypothetical protein